jgi:hypothetical protein
VLVAALGLASDAWGQAKASGIHVVKVEVEIVPSLVVSGLEETSGARLDVGPGGVIVGSIPFGLRANTGAVRLQVGATALYKGADPNASAIIPLELLHPARLLAAPAEGAAGGGVHDLVWTDADFSSHGLHGLFTAQAALESGSAQGLRADVNVQVCWSDGGLPKPTGAYAGYVKLIAEVVPPQVEAAPGDGR